MSDPKKDDVKYREQRNVAYKENAVLNALLKTVGIEPDAIKTALEAFNGVNIQFEQTGEVKPLSISDAQQSILNDLAKPGAKKDDSDKSDGDKGDDAIAAAVAKALKDAGIETPGESDNSTKAPGGHNPSNGKTSSTGLTNEVVDAMSEEQINENWDAISTALKNGTIGSTQTA